MDKTFLAYQVEKKRDTFLGKVLERSISDLPKGNLTVKVFYSSLNYKDALSASGAKGVTRNYPHTPGIDAVGEVVDCLDNSFEYGDKVIVTGYDLGMDTAGGFGQYIRVPSSWAVPLPAGLSMYESMCLGTAGLTAAIGIDLLEKKNGISGKKAIVNGATGGVGYLALDILSMLGSDVTAVTTKLETKKELSIIGAKEIMSIEEFKSYVRQPLSKGIWDIGYDVVGGELLSDMLTVMKVGGSIACCGNVGGATFSSSVFPFILRGNSLLGVDSQGIEHSNRTSLWNRLATDWKPFNLERFSREIQLKDLDDEITKILNGKQIGRVIIRLR